MGHIRTHTNMENGSRRYVPILDKCVVNSAFGSFRLTHNDRILALFWNCLNIDVCAVFGQNRLRDKIAYFQGRP